MNVLTATPEQVEAFRRDWERVMSDPTRVVSHQHTHGFLLMCFKHGAPLSQWRPQPIRLHDAPALLKEWTETGVITVRTDPEIPVEPYGTRSGDGWDVEYRPLLVYALEGHLHTREETS